jgi:hypothetical protein
MLTGRSVCSPVRRRRALPRVVLNRRKLMRRKFGAMAVVILGIATVAVGLSHTGIMAQQSKADGVPDFKVPDLKMLAADKKLPDGVRDAVEKTVYGKVYSAWPMGDGTFYLGVATQDGHVHGFLFKTGELKADAMVKAILMAQEKQLRVGAYDDPKTGMLGGVCVFNP